MKRRCARKPCSRAGAKLAAFFLNVMARAITPKPFSPLHVSMAGLHKDQNRLISVLTRTFSTFSFLFVHTTYTQGEHLQQGQRRCKDT